MTKEVLTYWLLLDTFYPLCFIHKLQSKTQNESKGSETLKLNSRPTLMILLAFIGDPDKLGNVKKVVLCKPKSQHGELLVFLILFFQN